MRLLALHRGRAAEIPATGTEAWWDKPWRTGFIKQSHAGPIYFGPTGLDGDEQAGLINHGGVDNT